MKDVEQFFGKRPKVAPLFLDAEFTDLDPDGTPGLNPDGNEIWELGWILDKDGHLFSEQNWLVDHTARASDWVIKYTSYTERVWKPMQKGISFPKLDEALKELIADCQAVQAEGYQVNLVGAAPWYDVEYLRRAFRKYGLEMPMDWRHIPIETMFMGWVNSRSKTKMYAPTSVYKMLKYLDIPGSDDIHTTAGDNFNVRKIYYAIYDDQAENKEEEAA